MNRYADLGYVQIKLYGSLEPELVPGIAKLAHSRGLRMSGHIPWLAAGLVLFSVLHLPSCSGRAKDGPVASGPRVGSAKSRALLVSFPLFPQLLEGAALKEVRVGIFKI